ncbi:MAG: alpha/beta hydrolase-fold protein [Flavobacteriaceae bacterium]|nr:alpha/beta hydrolase-fold protein [Flavobacteriaceae bacterium]
MKLHYISQEPQCITAETPLLVLLHGYGSNEADLFSFAPDLPKDWLVVSFQAPRNTPYGGFCWYDIDFTNSEKFIDVVQAQESIRQIISNIEEIRAKYGITEGKTHLCGFSQGGILSYALALESPHLFQKVACLSAYPEQKILQDIKDKKALQHLRFFVSHGTEDNVIPIEWGRRGKELLYDLSVFFSFREYVSGHGINAKNYQYLMEFFQQ